MKLFIPAFLAFLGIIACIGVAIYLLINYGEGAVEKEHQAISVIDGDTFVLDNGEIIRLLCIDTPEKNQAGYENASEFLSELILMKNVSLENPEELGFQQEDVYGRRLAFVYVGDILVNKEMIRGGFSGFYDFNGTAEKCREFMGM